MEYSSKVEQSFSLMMIAVVISSLLKFELVKQYSVRSGPICALHLPTAPLRSIYLGTEYRNRKQSNTLAA
jgi:Tfp pilus assembly major pilin PilA